MNVFFQAVEVSPICRCGWSRVPDLGCDYSALCAAVLVERQAERLPPHGRGITTTTCPPRHGQHGVEPGSDGLDRLEPDNTAANPAATLRGEPGRQRKWQQEEGRG